MIVGRVRNAHGIRGEVVVESLTSEPDARFAVGRRLLGGTAKGELSPPDTPGPHTLTIRRSKPFKGGWILRLEELADRNAADLWRGRYLLVPSEEIEPPASDEVYFHDLVGLRVERSDGDALGRVEALHEMPQGLVLEVSTKVGTLMLPYRPEVVTTVDLGRRAVVVQVPEGLMDDVAEDRDTADQDAHGRDTEDGD
jgi:16S rRNA processing protein RimM